MAGATVAGQVEAGGHLKKVQQLVTCHQQVAPSRLVIAHLRLPHEEMRVIQRQPLAQRRKHLQDALHGQGALAVHIHPAATAGQCGWMDRL